MSARYRPLRDVQSTELVRIIDLAVELGWRCVGVVVEPTWTDAVGAEDETAMLLPPGEPGRLYVFATAGAALSALLRMTCDDGSVVTVTCGGPADVERCVRAHGLVDVR